MKTVIKKIKVSKNGIRRGIVQDDRCPIALGMIASGIKNPSVDADKISGEYKKEFFSVQPPKYISKWIATFDNGNSRLPNRRVKPFNFSLKIKIDE
jgi:hypothetical protein